MRSNQPLRGCDNFCDINTYGAFSLRASTRVDASPDARRRALTRAVRTRLYREEISAISEPPFVGVS